jgi:hypothetical protein
MAQRYGRRQKRRAREQIERLSRERGSFLMTASDLRRRLDELHDVIRNWDAEIRHLLGPYTSFAINDTTFHVGPNGIRQLPVLGPIGPPEMYDGSQIPSEVIERRAVNILELIITSHIDIDPLRRYMRFKLKQGYETRRDLGEAGYAFSEPLWRDLQRAPPEAKKRMVRQIAEDVGRILLKPQTERKYG